MKIDTSTSRLYASQSAQTSAASDDTSASFLAALSTATAGESTSDAEDAEQTDFTSMTRQEMQDWSNEQIRSGNMSLDEGLPFMAMTMKIPVDGGTAGELHASADGERVDFTEKVRVGIEGAISRNDEDALSMLEKAMETMQQYQDETSSSNSSA
ncbi:MULTISPECIES: hypothetical protein [unclassified Rhizobium]|uniref:hypothetical protein n=1 Tax=unclassified Rhizobium TaxID=2613769 RepID=UPI001AEA7E51|nr:MULTISPECIES: hypothetical protein [unclassified Rhizobium]MBP2462362.1 hypothetical protein [Rhizobium sp. PvP014]MBP2529756.1 hypothetical protein [Rhizobium sp. PvP099]